MIAEEVLLEGEPVPVHALYANKQFIPPLLLHDASAFDSATAEVAELPTPKVPVVAVFTLLYNAPHAFGPNSSTSAQVAAEVTLEEALTQYAFALSAAKAEDE